MNVLDKFIPHSSESEQSVLGAVLLKSAALDEISTLKPDHFYVGAHREIFRVMLGMSATGKQIDVITLATEINERGLDGETGGLVYLGELAENTPSAANIKRYAEIVQAKSVERQLLAACTEIHAAVQSNGPTKEKLNKAPGNPYGKPSNSRIDRFSKVLMEYGYTVIVRKTRGDDIDAACGQLVGDVIDRTKRTMKKRMQEQEISVKML